MVFAEVADDFHHYFAVDFVVVDDFLHQRYFVDGDVLVSGLFVASPCTDHCAESVDRGIGPVGLDEFVRVHGVGDRFEAEFQCATDDDGFFSHGLLEEVEPA